MAKCNYPKVVKTNCILYAIHILQAKKRHSCCAPIWIAFIPVVFHYLVCYPESYWLLRISSIFLISIPVSFHFRSLLSFLWFLFRCPSAFVFALQYPEDKLKQHVFLLHKCWGFGKLLNSDRLNACCCGPFCKEIKAHRWEMNYSVFWSASRFLFRDEPVNTMKLQLKKASE